MPHAKPPVIRLRGISQGQIIFLFHDPIALFVLLAKPYVVLKFIIIILASVVCLKIIFYHQ